MLRWRLDRRRLRLRLRLRLRRHPMMLIVPPPLLVMPRRRRYAHGTEATGQVSTAHDRFYAPRPLQ